MAEVLFVPGTGLNSEPERRLLGPVLRKAGIDAAFWNEPSALRPDGTPFRADDTVAAVLRDLQARVARATRPVVLVGCSLGAWTVARLASDPGARERVHALVLSGPVLDPVPAHRAILELCRDDFAETDPDRARRLVALLATAREPYDESFRSGLALAMDNPRLLSHYFASDSIRRAWTEVVSEPSWGIDGAALDAFLRDLRRDPAPARGALGVPVHAVFGDRDPLTDADREGARVGALNPAWRRHVLRDAGHFPHLEAPDAFVRLLAAVRADA